MQEQEYGRTTITVPKPLKRRMKQAGCGVNWSAVACEAFRQKLRKLENDRKQKAEEALPSKEQAIERLRRLKSAGPQESAPGYQAGFEAGTAWAMSDAHPDELSRLESIAAELRLEEGFGDVKPPAFKRMMRQLTVHILGAHESEGSNPRDGRLRRRGMEFWEHRAGMTERPPSMPWVHGFVKGALAFWRDVKEKM